MRNKGTLWMRGFIHKRDRGTCQYCGAEGLDFQTGFVDHIVPKSSGGTDDDFNLRLSCKSCNSRKGTQSVEQFRLLMMLAQTPAYKVITASQAQRLIEVGIDLKLPPPFRFHFEIPEAA